MKKSKFNFKSKFWSCDTKYDLTELVIIGIALISLAAVFTIQLTK